ncbi:translation initiation factor IF-2 isoform X1 [Ixodes scapularis]|uniref:translation initiation factor IF-2 isoform X1 n=1 Tax=Ixodes scapularis TaxID=6945 RepID=UPI001C394D6C|nr:translation initiation factor IF-2 isoform X1 [Ixodes scapularis]
MAVEDRDGARGHGRPMAPERPRPLVAAGGPDPPQVAARARLGRACGTLPQAPAAGRGVLAGRERRRAVPLRGWLPATVARERGGVQGRGRRDRRSALLSDGAGERQRVALLPGYRRRALGAGKGLSQARVAQRRRHLQDHRQGRLRSGRAPGAPVGLPGAGRGVADRRFLQGPAPLQPPRDPLCELHREPHRRQPRLHQGAADPPAAEATCESPANGKRPGVAVPGGQPGPLDLPGAGHGARRPGTRLAGQGLPASPGALPLLVRGHHGSGTGHYRQQLPEPREPGPAGPVRGSKVVPGRPGREHAQATPPAPGPDRNGRRPPPGVPHQEAAPPEGVQLARPAFGALVRVVGRTFPRLKRRVRVYIFGTGRMIRAHAKENFELACRINESLTLFPLAFRTHTHKLGKAVTGYLVWTGQWTNIGKHSPQEPQMFYPAKIGLKIVKGDMLVRLALLGCRFLIVIGTCESVEAVI